MESANPTPVDANQSTSMAARASDIIDNTTSGLGRGIDGAAHRVGDTVSRAVESVSGAGQYLQDASPGELRSDVTDFVKKHPKASIAVGLGLGFLLTRALTR